MNAATALEKHSADADIQQQTRALESLQASPYLRAFQPRAYPLYDVRHYRPREYLASIGVEKISELVQHGFSLGEICNLVDVSMYVMRKWITQTPGAMKEIEEARLFAADEERAQAKRVLYDQRAYPDTPRAKAIADFHLWTAERWNKDLYGTKQVKLDANLNVGVSYEFIIRDGNKAATPSNAQVLEGVFAEVDKALPSVECVEPTIFDIPLDQRPSLDFSKD